MGIDSSTFIIVQQAQSLNARMEVSHCQISLPTSFRGVSNIVTAVNGH